MTEPITMLPFVWPESPPDPAYSMVEPPRENTMAPQPQDASAVRDPDEEFKAMMASALAPETLAAALVTTPSRPTMPMIGNDVPMNPTMGRMTIDQIAKLGWELTLVPEVRDTALAHYNLTEAELHAVQQSPVYQHAAQQAAKQASDDPMVALRMLARGALPDVIKQLHKDGSSAGTEPNHRVQIAKVLTDLADPGTAASRKAQAGHSGLSVAINFGSTMGGMVGAAQHNITIENQS